MYYIYAIAKDYLYKFVIDDNIASDTKLTNRLNKLSEAYIFINSKFRICYFLNLDELKYRIKNLDTKDYIICETTEPEFEFTEKYRLEKLNYFKDSLNKNLEDLNSKKEKLDILNKKYGELDKDLAIKIKRSQLQDYIKEQLDLCYKISDLKQIVKNRKLAVRYFDRYFYKEFKSFLFYNRHVVTSASRFSSTILIKNREYIFIDGMYHLFNFKYYENSDYKSYTIKNNLDFLRFFLIKYDEFNKELIWQKSLNETYSDFIRNKFIQVLNSIKEHLVEYEI